MGVPVCGARVVAPCTREDSFAFGLFCRFEADILIRAPASVLPLLVSVLYGRGSFKKLRGL